MKTVKTKNGQIFKFYTTKEVFKNVLKSENFRKTYNEELARIQLAKQIRELRSKKQLTQKEVANKAKIPQSVIARIESGNHSFSLGTLSRIAHVFKKEIQLI
jgi:DNA-binding XRE family transcriptional regulator